MRDLYYDLSQALSKGESIAFGQVIQTRGSTPQKPGAKALFWADGRSSGTLGGGCLEAEARRVALDCLRQQQRTLLTLHLDSDFGWDDGLICGGTARLFLDGAVNPAAEFWSDVADFLTSRSRGVLLTIVDATDPESIGRRFLIEIVEGEAKVRASFPEGIEPDEGFLAIARKVVEEAEPMALRLEGPVAWWEVFAEPLLPKPSLIIAGAGHIGAALAHLAALLDFSVTVVDDRPSFANRERFPQADKVLVGDIPTLVADQPMDQDTYIVIVTRGHRHDAQVLRKVITQIDQVAYIGMIGSRRKIKLIYDQLLEENLATRAQLEKVHSPLGIDIGGETVWEIALSIAAELVWVRNGQKGTLQPLHRQMWSLLSRSLISQ
ncbi:MAG: XdhC family protein [Armatimonadetes bacterium]|nr:XdhC family protein [Armatimonadota bacterium]MDW8120724.1 XdhC family protein [Armatimonadota bacterium]